MLSASVVGAASGAGCDHGSCLPTHEVALPRTCARGAAGAAPRRPRCMTPICSAGGPPSGGPRAAPARAGRWAQQSPATVPQSSAPRCCLHSWRIWGTGAVEWEHEHVQAAREESTCSSQGGRARMSRAAWLCSSAGAGSLQEDDAVVVIPQDLQQRAGRPPKRVSAGQPKLHLRGHHS